MLTATCAEALWVAGRNSPPAIVNIAKRLSVFIFSFRAKIQAERVLCAPSNLVAFLIPNPLPHADRTKRCLAGPRAESSRRGNSGRIFLENRIAVGQHLRLCLVQSSIVDVHALSPILFGFSAAFPSKKRYRCHLSRPPATLAAPSANRRMIFEADRRPFGDQCALSGDERMGLWDKFGEPSSRRNLQPRGFARAPFICRSFARRPSFASA